IRRCDSKLNHWTQIAALRRTAGEQVRVKTRERSNVRIGHLSGDNLNDAVGRIDHHITLPKLGIRQKKISSASIPKEALAQIVSQNKSWGRRPTRRIRRDNHSRDRHVKIIGHAVTEVENASGREEISVA